MEQELIKLVVVGLPNFLGLIVALYFMDKQNKALLELLRECNERKEGREGDIPLE